jgi:hypothetical protein
MRQYLHAGKSYMKSFACSVPKLCGKCLKYFIAITDAKQGTREG